jgi:hypothetical protein
MHMSRREKGLAFGTLAVLVLFLADRYVLTPFLDQQGALEAQRGQILTDISRAQNVMNERRQLAPKWKGMVAGGLKSDPAEAEGQLLHALRDWAKETGFALSSLKPDRPDAKDQLKEVHVVATGNGNMESTAKFLWKMQGSAFPLKVLDFQLSSRSDGANDLALQVKVSTLYLASVASVAKTDKPSNGGAR